MTKQKIVQIDQNNLAYHPGPVSPPGGDGSPLAANVLRQIGSLARIGKAGIDIVGLICFDK